MNSTSTSSTVLVNGYSHIGKAKGRYYEDRIKFGLVTTSSGLLYTLGIVADGIGGENAGERAATITIDGVFDYIENSNETDIPQILKKALEAVNTEVYKEAQRQNSKKNMGSTAAVALIFQNRLYIANIGDSRIYLVRDNQITQLTVDHTWEREVVQAGKLRLAEAARHPRRDELVRSIGYEATVKVDLGVYVNNPGISEEDAFRSQGFQLKPGDRVVLCSDGLIKSLPKGSGHFVELPEIIKIINETSNDEAPEQLVQRALDRNVDDNVSAIVLEVPGGKRPFRISAKTRTISGISVAILILAILGIRILSQITSTAPPLPALPTITGNQIYVAQVWQLSLNVHSSSTGLSQLVQQGDLLNFEQDQNIQSIGDNGYVYFGLPGQAQLYLASNTEITLKSISDTQFDILLNQGSIVVNQPGRKFLIYTPNGAQAWISGSMMGLFYDINTQELYIDCLQDKCWIGNNQPLPAGFFALMKGTEIISSGTGTRNELWQFVPNLVATPTPTLTMTPSITPDIKATQTCGYLQGLGTPCPPPR